MKHSLFILIIILSSNFFYPQQKKILVVTGGKNFEAESFYSMFDRMTAIGWTNVYKNSKIVFLQPGHDHYAFENSNVRRLIFNSINWVSEK